MPIDPDFAAQWLLERPLECAACCAMLGPEKVTKLLSGKGPGKDADLLSDRLERSIREDVFAAACAIAKRYMAACEASPEEGTVAPAHDRERAEGARAGG
ncbi:hypothetical protein [Cereibacter sphaeroides]|uniref:hypothetical protein n=1 Tax=Cereibacter sphaeroides TaxID=1063 RepID=UPI001F394675|nr:hypothetical protein [Cereibacter sphaeroides]MCE6966995.1 hypothetical protein [Cereibacter sphaeroides]